jgi:hypothetical protein
MGGKAKTLGLTLVSEELKTEALSIVEQAKAIQVTTHEESILAADFLKGIKALKKKVEEKLAPLVKSAYDSWKMQVKYRKEHDAPLDQAESDIKYKLSCYLQEQERLRRVEETRLQLEAQKKAEELAEQDALLLDATGDVEAAEAVRAEPVVAPLVVIAPVAKVEGVGTQSVWKFQVTDPDLIPREYLEIDVKRIGAVVRAMKQATNIPGVQVFEEKIVKTF